MGGREGRKKGEMRMNCGRKELDGETNRGVSPA